MKEAGATTPDREVVRERVRHFISLRTTSGEAPEVANAASALAAANDLYRDLSQWVGHDGSHALFSRSFAQARARHPALADLKLSVRSEPYLTNLAKIIKAHGDSDAGAGIEAMLVALFDLLSRLIGDDILTRLIDGSLPDSRQANSSTAPRRENNR